MSIKKTLACAGIGIASLAAMEELSVVSDRPSHIYRVGETVIFRITGPAESMANVELSCDGEAVLQTLQVKTPAEVPFALSSPGVLRCTVRVPGQKRKMCAVAFDPEQIQAVLPEPDDFSAFWQQGLTDLAAIPADFKMTLREDVSTPEAEIYELECANVNSSRHYGFLRLPKTSAKLPLLVYVEGAGPGQSLETFQEHCGNVRKFMRHPVAALTIGVHAYKPADSTAAHKEQQAEYLRNLGVRSYWLEGLGKDNRETFLYRAILGGVRMIDEVVKLPAIDASRVAYLGASQGGAFGLYLTALSPHLKAAFCGVPCFGDVGGFLLGRHPTQSSIPELREHWSQMRYFDTVNFARRINVPVFISIGFIDTSCPPASVFPIYNALNGPKLLFNKVINGHGDAPIEYEALTWYWVARHLQLEL